MRAFNRKSKPKHTTKYSYSYHIGFAWWTIRTSRTTRNFKRYRKTFSVYILESCVVGGKYQRSSRV